ncbi:MAG: hypothetical protein U1C47_19110 [Hydrogenophaga sp.]|nr:hypothetical protein [Hydrogenophaga sp.]
MKPISTDEVDRNADDDFHHDSEKIEARSLRVAFLEGARGRLGNLNDKLLDDIVQLEISYEDAIDPRQFVFDGDR